MHTALIVEDHPLTRMAIRMILENHHITVLAEAADGPTALTLMRRFDPALLVLDICLPKMDGLEVISRMRAQGMQQKILVISSQTQAHFARRCARVGAQGFIAKNRALDELADAIKTLRAGRVFLPEEACSGGFNGRRAEKSHREGTQLSELSDREMIVLQYLAQGWSNKQIADALLLSNKTICTYKTRLMNKLASNNLAELITLARRNGLVEVF